MLLPGTTFGRYIVNRKLAEGGMAEIYLASAIGAEGFTKEVVIKAVRSFLAQDRQFIEMFLAEAKLGSRLNHANIVSIFDFGKNAEDYYLAMEYVRGASVWDLRKRCREQGVPFPPVLVAEIGAQVARGLQYAHSVSDRGQPIGLVHRDVTPHNILLSFEGAVKLTDFGIAKASTTHTAPGMLKGKFAYMSPEQARGEKVDARTDVFALGIVLWEMLTGGKLFDADTDVGVLRAVQDSTISPATRLNPDVPQDLSDIIQKALARDLPARFASAFDFERALASFVLRNAQTPEDTSVSFFLQHMFKEEFERDDSASPTPATAPGDVSPRPLASLADDDSDMAHGDTRALQRAKLGGQTMTATPIKSNPLPATPLPGSPSGIIPSGALAEAGRPTEQMQGSNSSRGLPAVKKGTEQMKSVRGLPKVELPQNVPFDALPTPTPQVESESSDDFDDQQQGFEDDQAAVQRSRLPLIAGLAGLVVFGAVGTFVALRGGSKGSEPVAAVESTSRKTSEEAAQIEPVPPPVVVAAPPAVEPAVVAKTEPAVVTPSGGAAGQEGDSKKPNDPAVTPPVVAKSVPVVPKKSDPQDPPNSASKQRANGPTGTLVIRASPYANVLLDGKKLADAEGTKAYKVSAGPHVLTLSHPKWKKVTSVTIAAEATSTVSFDAFGQSFEQL